MDTTCIPATNPAGLPGSCDTPRNTRASPAPLLSLVICTLNEHEAIGDVLRELRLRLRDISHEIIVVDDSPDQRTADAVRAHALDDPHVRLLHRQHSCCLSSAAIAGWDVACGRILAIMDGDGQHDPALLEALLEELENPDIDVAIASRYLRDSRSGLHGLRHGLSRAGVRLADGLLGVRLADPLSGCFAMTSEWYAQVRGQLSGLGFKILIDIVASGHKPPRTAQVPTMLRTRLGGTSKLDSRVIIDLITLLIEKRSRGRLSAGRMMSGTTTLAALCTQWLVLAVLPASAAPFWALFLLSVGGGLASRFLIAYLLTPRTFRPRGLRGLGQRLASFGRARWTDIPLNAGAGLALHSLGCPWALAVLAGVSLTELRYCTGAST